MIITVGGYPGSGTTTLCRRLAETFGLTHVYAGQIFREMAAQTGVTLEEFGATAESTERIDVEVDRRQREAAVDNTVVEGRITAFIVDADLKIWLVAPLEVRAQRVASRETIPIEEAVVKITEREESERKRYKKYYDIVMEDLSLYDLIINTELWDAEGVFEITKAAIEVRKW
ncbi:MAG: AAA family ATPase [Theionarchaea archaeon]|nr:AAA family ATPase [Theionarchaea archaeon]MBU7036328.1 AAA family ATPase [Theionarchaea archaeon]